MLGWLIYQATQGHTGVVGGLFSSTYTSLKDRQISKISTEFPDWLGTLKETKTYGLAFYIAERFGGGVMCLRNLDESTKYKSAEFAIIGIDELTEHPADTFNILLGSLRWPGIKDTVFMAGSNPDGIGNEWVKNYFIYHRYPEEMQPYDKQFNFVPALPTDNKYLDESYWMMLRALPEDLRRAWLEGDWNVFKGLAFKSFKRKTHVLEPFEIPSHWVKFMGIDSGYRAPFCALFAARNPDNGRIIIYKEIYEVGLTDRQQARRILDLSDESEKNILRFADPAMWTRQTGEQVTTSAQIYAQNGVYIRKGDNDRINGKRRIDRLLGNLPDGKPGLQIFTTCPNLIRQMTQLMYDKNRPEDVLTTMEDHAYDASKYLTTNTREYVDKKKKYREPSPYQRKGLRL